MDTFERRWRILEILCEGPQMRETLLERLIDLNEGEADGLSPSNLSADAQGASRLGHRFP